jgi:hypothetical protein
MALRAIDVATRDARTRSATSAPATGALRTPLLSPPRRATVTELRPASRAVALAAARRERRRWLVVGAVVFGAPFLACVGVLEVIR